MDKRKNTLPDSIQIVLFDMAGTTVNDRSCGKSMVLEAMVGAFANAGIAISEKAVLRHRGKPKREAVSKILSEQRPFSGAFSDKIEDQVYGDFLTLLRERIESAEEMRGASDVFRLLKARGIRVGMGSGFPTEIAQALVDRFGWKRDRLIDYLGTAESVGAGRPDPKMIHDIMAAFSVDDPRRVVKVGDTEADILEGKNAGSWTVAVLSGTQPRELLEALHPDFLVGNIEEIPDLFSRPLDCR